MKIQHLQDLEAAIARGCQGHGCKHDHGPVTELYLHQTCHPYSGIEARYRQGSGHLELACNVCSRPVAVIAVATDLSRQ